MAAMTLRLGLVIMFFLALANASKETDLQRDLNRLLKLKPLQSIRATLLQNASGNHSTMIDGSSSSSELLEDSPSSASSSSSSSSSSASSASSSPPPSPPPPSSSSSASSSSSSLPPPSSSFASSSSPSSSASLSSSLSEKGVFLDSEKDPENDPMRGDRFLILGAANGSRLDFTTRLSAGPECGSFFLRNGEEGILYSGDGNTRLKCTSFIESPVGTTINIRCPHFDLATKGCRNEKLIVNDPVGNVVVKGCKRKSPTMRTSSNQLMLQHIRKPLRGQECSGGFMCSVSVGRDPTVMGQCGTYNIQSEDATVIFSTNDGRKRNCDYNIQGPTGSNLKIGCSVFSLQTSGCRKEKLVVQDNISGEQLTYCSNTPPDLTALTNTMKVKHTRKPLKRQCSGGFLCFVGASAGGGGGGGGGGTGPTSPSACPSSSSQITRPFCDGCGCGQVTVPRIVGGEVATPGEYPWQALLEIGSNICGGTLITKDWILTAAHCFVLTGKTSTTGYLGLHDMRNGRSGVQSFKSSYIVNHPNYDSVTQDNDVALVRLETEATLSNQVKTICLADQQDASTDDQVIATGWGVLQAGSTQVSSSLREVALDIISASECRSLYKNLYPITDNMLCTLTSAKDACQGDSGGPLIKQLPDGRWVQVGVVSFGEGCAAPKKPGVFSKVANYIEWIRQTTGSANC